MGARKILVKDIRVIVSKLIKEYSPEKVILFGSLVDGKFGADSDIDLLIIKKTEERFIDRWASVKKILRGTHRSIPLDAFVLTPKEIEMRLSVGDQFIEEALKGKVLYAQE